MTEFFASSKRLEFVPQPLIVSCMTENIFYEWMDETLLGAACPS
jgi:hypothetical protein